VSSTDAAGNAKECLTVVTDGHVGVNQADPTAVLHVHSGDPAQGDIQLFSAAADFEYDGGGDKTFVFKDTGGRTAFVGGNVGIGSTTPTARLEVQGNADQPGTARFVADPAKGPHQSHVHWDPTGDWYVRSASPVGKVVIQDSGGKVGIGTANPAATLDVTGDMHLNGDAFITGFLWAVSDAREKHRIEPIERPLERLLALRGKIFAWREHGASAARHMGFVAQDVETVFPEWVKETPWGIKAVNVTGLNPLLVEGMRELTMRCEKLEADVADLRERLAKHGGAPPAPRKPARRRAPRKDAPADPDRR
jgi:hypothetical protein